ncbi:spherulation-specific family 4 protein [Hydrogenobaculum acidophilum]
MKSRLSILVLIGFIFTIYSCGASSGNGSNTTSSNPLPTSVEDIIIPLYSYPIGQYANEWQTLYNFNTNKKVYVIVNPSNGPGSSVDPNFTNAITNLKSKGFYVLGYVDTNYANNSISNVESEISNWFSFYPNIDGIFLDNVSTNNYNYYSSLYSYIKSKNSNYIVVLNPGTNIPNSYFNISDKIIVYEDTFQNFLNYNSSYSQEPSSNVCIIVTNTPTQNDFYTAMDHGFSINSSCQYITNYSGTNTYYYISNYLPSY